MITTVVNVLSIIVLLFLGLCAAFLCVEEVKMHRLTIKHQAKVEDLGESILRIVKR